MKDSSATTEQPDSTSASTPSGSYKEPTVGLAQQEASPEVAGTAANSSEPDFAMRLESAVAGSKQSVKFLVDLEQQQERRTLAKLNSRLQRIKRR